MKIIADSGSTKTSWRIIFEDGRIEQNETLGLNPYYSSVDELSEQIKTSFLNEYTHTELNLFLYGSGCESQEMKDRMKDIMGGLLKEASIEVHGDMLGAARATCRHEHGLVGILGTGSNSCLYNGSEIIQNVDSLGFVMGDEGSGNHMGRLLIAKYLRKSIAPELSAKIDTLYKLTRDDILRNVYKGDRPSRFLAQFAKFIFQHRSHPEMALIINQSFHAFFIEHVRRYPENQQSPLHFVGSIAYYFSDQLRRVAKDYGVQIKNILENPIAGLTLYHTDNQ